MHNKLLSWILNLPPIAWITQHYVQYFVKRRIKRGLVTEATLDRAATIGLQATLEGIVKDVVNVLGYAGAMVATYEQGDTLPVRAIFVDPIIATREDIQRWEKQISALVNAPISITDPDIARVYVYQDRYQENLSVKAATAGGPVTSQSLYDLFRPIAPAASRAIVKGIQRALGVQDVIAVPFFLETVTNGSRTQELVGNLFAAKRTRISEQDKLILSAFGRQAAAAIGSERRRLQLEIAQKMTFNVQANLLDEAEIYKWIVKGVVNDLGYVGAMVAPYEMDDSLPVRALYVDQSIATQENIQHWEAEVSRVVGYSVHIDDPEIARVYRHDAAYHKNLSVRAVEAGHPVTSDNLYDLFQPIAPSSSQPVIAAIQETLLIKQVIAVPFFMEVLHEGACHKTLIGNLFAATRSQTFKPSEIQLLHAFGQQAAAGIRNARLYKRAEEQRLAAQMFGKMAFSAATSVHALRNHVGVVQMYLDLLPKLSPSERDSYLEDIDNVYDRLQQIITILDTLREPWQPVTDDVLDVNDSLHNAVERITALPPTKKSRCNGRLRMTHCL